MKLLIFFLYAIYRIKFCINKIKNLSSMFKKKLIGEKFCFQNYNLACRYILLRTPFRSCDQFIWSRDSPVIKTHFPGKFKTTWLGSRMDELQPELDPS